MIINDATFPTYGVIEWTVLKRAVSLANGCEWSQGGYSYIGHAQANINMNSLNRIVTAFIAEVTKERDIALEQAEQERGALREVLKELVNAVEETYRDRPMKYRVSTAMESARQILAEESK